MNREIKKILVACSEELWTVNLARRATAILDREQAKRSRKQARTLPRRRAERKSRDERVSASQAIRNAVMARANGRCELCGSEKWPRLEWHHLMPAAGRRQWESINSTLGVCLYCHGEWHGGNVIVLEKSYQKAGEIGAGRIVLDSLRRRIDKVKP